LKVDSLAFGVVLLGVLVVICEHNLSECDALASLQFLTAENAEVAELFIELNKNLCVPLRALR